MHFRRVCSTGSTSDGITIGFLPGQYFFCGGVVFPQRSGDRDDAPRPRPIRAYVSTANKDDEALPTIPAWAGILAGHPNNIIPFRRP